MNHVLHNETVQFATTYTCSIISTLIIQSPKEKTVSTTAQTVHIQMPAKKHDTDCWFFFFAKTQDPVSHHIPHCVLRPFSAADSDRELSFINCSRSLVDASIAFLKLMFGQSHTCMQIILLRADSVLPCKASSNKVQPSS